MGEYPVIIRNRWYAGLYVVWCKSFGAAHELAVSFASRDGWRATAGGDTIAAGVDYYDGRGMRYSHITYRSYGR